MIEITKYHLDVLENVSHRLTNLANSLPDNRISFAVELSTRPYGVIAYAYEWSDLCPTAQIEEIEQAEWFFDRKPEAQEENRLEFLSKISEWEVKYGVL